jgi:flagellar hook-associated protein 2
VATTPIASVGGLATGLDTNSIISQLVDVERAMANPIKARGNAANTALLAYAMIRTGMQGVTSASQKLSHPADWRQLTATSSQPDAVAVSAGTGTFGGALTFSVDALAAAGSFRSVNTIAGTSTPIATDAAILVAAGGAQYGFSTLTSDDALSAGAHTIAVTQASAGATKHGGTVLAGSTTIDGTNDTLQLDVNGSSFTLTIAHGTYTSSDLAAAVQAAAVTEGAPVNVAVNTALNKLQIATTREGSAATLQVTGGSALGALGLTTDGAALTGTDGIVQIDGGTAQTFTNIEAGATISLSGGTGTITAVLSGGLRAGTLNANNVAVGDGSLGTVVGAINSAGAGVTATAVQVGDNIYRLQITSNTAGADMGTNIAATEFGTAVGGFITLSEASDAQITVGTGPGAYTVTASSNTISGVLPGVTLTLKSTTSSPVTVSVSRDGNALADKVQALVDAANLAKTDIDKLTAFDATTLTSSPLTGDSTASRLITALTRAFTSAVPGATPGSPGLAGVAIDRDGNFTFDRSKFLTAFASNPDGLARLFTQGGSASTSDIEFVSAGDRAVAGTYDVNVTQIALQASSTGLSGSWPTTPTTVSVRVNNTTASYDVGASDTQDDVAAGLNAAFADAGLALQAVVSGTGIEVHTTAYGSAQKFDVAWDGTNYATVAGQDVQGTINGVAATGVGQQLLAPFTDNTVGGLALRISATTTGAIGTFTYTPGVAQRVTSAVSAATDLVSGYITSRENDYKARIRYINDHLASMEVRITRYEQNLRRQFAALEASIGQMKAQSDWLASQVQQLPKASSNNS